MAKQLTLEEMDANALEAKRELLEMASSPLAEDEPTLTDIANWWRKHLMLCGHKRLGRIVLKFASAET